ncbi:TTF-type domain-containing protein [Citrus sinensis]|uniref:TTF-type domain-containing protein n=1 Tax=Citrus sinensis TaxID=2711 RepID=A0ACB8JIG9_CITSI|nr:TTF-type domain-containing protein [Citrus sinensis]
MIEKQHIATFFERQSEKTQSEYETRLNAVVDCIRFLLNQGLAFRGHDESHGSSNKWNFLELLRFLVDQNEDINAVTFRNTPQNLQLTSPKIQKDISRDISTKEQMVVVLHYVDKNGYVVERFVGIEHVSSTTIASLKESLDNMFSRFGLSLSMLCGQHYDGLSNMQVNVVGVSAKRCDILHEKYALAVIEALGKSELSSGQGLNKEITLKRPANTCWSSHCGRSRRKA